MTSRDAEGINTELRRRGLLPDRPKRSEVEAALRAQGVLTEDLVQWLAELHERVADLLDARAMEPDALASNFAASLFGDAKPEDR